MALALAALACDRGPRATIEAVPGARGETGTGGEAVASRPTGVPRPPATRWRGDFAIPRLPPHLLVLEGGAAGLDDLLRTVERALAESDTARLAALLPTETEFHEILYPSFPAAHPPIDASFETVWLLQLGDTRDGLRRLLREYGGRDVRILDVRFERPDQDMVNFRLHETSEVDLVLDGERRNGVRLFGSAVQIGNRWKVLSYPDRGSPGRSASRATPSGEDDGDRAPSRAIE